VEGPGALTEFHQSFSQGVEGALRLGARLAWQDPVLYALGAHRLGLGRLAAQQPGARAGAATGGYGLRFFEWGSDRHHSGIH